MSNVIQLADRRPAPKRTAEIATVVVTRDGGGLEVEASHEDVDDAIKMLQRAILVLESGKCEE